MVAVHGSSPDRLDWPSSHSLVWPGDEKKQAILTPAAATTGAISSGLLESEPMSQPPLLYRPYLALGRTEQISSTSSALSFTEQTCTSHSEEEQPTPGQANLSQPYYSLPLLWRTAAQALKPSRDFQAQHFRFLFIFFSWELQLDTVFHIRS